MDPELRGFLACRTVGARDCAVERHVEVQMATSELLEFRVFGRMSGACQVIGTVRLRLITLDYV